MRRLVLATLLTASLACGDRAASARGGAPSPAEQHAIADSLMALLSNAYDFSRPGVPGRIMALYPDSGRVVSAASGHVVTSRAALQQEIDTFWVNVGRNMQGARWIFDSVYVNVFSRDAAALTATYRIPHRTPAGEPHTIAGAWTAVFERRARGWVIVQEHLSDAPERDTAMAMSHDAMQP